MSLLSVQRSINVINAEKVFVHAYTAGSSTTVIDLSSLTDPLSGAALVNASGLNQPMLVLQSTDNDFYYAFGTNGSGTISAATAVYVTGKQQEYASPAAMPGRKYLYILRAGSSDAAVNLFVAKTAG